MSKKKTPVYSFDEAVDWLRRVNKYLEPHLLAYCLERPNEFPDATFRSFYDYIRKRMYENGEVCLIKSNRIGYFEYLRTQAVDRPMPEDYIKVPIPMYKRKHAEPPIRFPTTLFDHYFARTGLDISQAVKDGNALGVNLIKKDKRTICTAYNSNKKDGWNTKPWSQGVQAWLYSMLRSLEIADIQIGSKEEAKFWAWTDMDKRPIPREYYLPFVKKEIETPPVQTDEDPAPPPQTEEKAPSGLTLSLDSPAARRSDSPMSHISDEAFWAMVPRGLQLIALATPDEFCDRLRSVLSRVKVVFKL